jgi:chromosome partitioning related protein ParA
VTPEILAARELRRGTLQLIEDISPIPASGHRASATASLINRVHPVSSNAKLIHQALRDIFADHAGVNVLHTDVPAIEAYPRASTRGLPVHRVEYRQPLGRVAPAALETMRALAGELFPTWHERFALVTGKPNNFRGASHGERT